MRRVAVFIAIAAAGFIGRGSLTASAGDEVPEITETQRIGGQVNDLSFSEYFGIGMDFEGDQALIGAMTRNDPSVPRAGAVYDYRQDPDSGLWSLHDLLIHPDPVQNDNFGAGVARSGDFAIIGATGRGTWRYGSVFIYRYDAAADAWLPEQEIPHPGSLIDVSDDECPPPSELAKRSEFGSAVAISGDVALVSAPFEDLCFLRSDYTSTNPNDSLPDPKPGHCAVEDQDKDDCRLPDWATKKWVGTDAGVVYIFRRNTTPDDPDFGVWELEQRIEPTGLKLELSDDPDIAGSVDEDDYSLGAWGRRDGMVDIDSEFAVIGDDERELTWIYRYNPDEQTWSKPAQSPLESPTMPPPPPPNSGRRQDPCRCGFGSSVSMDDRWMAIGANLQDDDTLEGDEGKDLGSVFIYRWSPLLSRWNEAGLISPVELPERRLGDQFGRDVELTADTLVVGATPHPMSIFILGDGQGDPREDPGPGAAYVYDFDRIPPPSVTELFMLVASDGMEKDALGASLAYSDGTALVAATQRETSTGAVYIYDDLGDPAPAVAPVPEPARGLLTLAAAVTLALLPRFRLRRAR